MGYDTSLVSDAYSPVTLLDNADGDNLGFAVAINGNVAVATAPKDDVNEKIDQGSLYVFRRPIYFPLLPNTIFMNPPIIPVPIVNGATSF